MKSLNIRMQVNLNQKLKNILTGSYHSLTRSFQLTAEPLSDKREFRERKRKEVLGNLRRVNQHSAQMSMIWKMKLEATKVPLNVGNVSVT
jgi:hypothetical protein